MRWILIVALFAITVYGNQGFTSHQALERQLQQKDGNKLYEKAKFLSSDGSKNQIVIELYKEACKLEHAESCYMSGVLNDYWNPENLYLQKACELNHAKSCAHLGASNFSMEKGNTKKAIFYTKKACNEGDSESCGLLARMYKKGFKVKKSLTQAKIYQNGTEEIMLSNCHKGEGDACKNLGDIYNPDSVLSNHKSDPAYAIKLYKKGCELEDKGSCGALGDMYYDGKYASADDKTVLSLYEKSCGYLSLSSDYRCINAGKIAYLQKNYKKAVKYFEQYCRPQSHDTECSFMLGSMYLKGEGVEPNINKAKKFLKQSCDIGKKIQNKITEDVKYGCRAYNKLIEEVESKEQEEKLRVKQEQEERLRVQQEQEAIAKGCYYLDGTLNIGTIEGYATTNFRGYDFILDEKYYIATPGRYSTFSKNRKLSLVVKKTGRNREVSLLDLYPYETKQGESEYSKSAVRHKRRYPASKFKTLEVFSLVGTWSEICQ